MAPRSGHVCTTSPAVTQSPLHAWVVILASYWVSDEVPLIYRPAHAENGPYAARGLSICGEMYSYPTAMDLIAEALAHLFPTSRVLTDVIPPSYSHLGTDRLHRDTRNQDMTMAPRSGHVSTTSPAVTQSPSHASVTILAS